MASVRSLLCLLLLVTSGCATSQHVGRTLGTIGLTTALVGVGAIGELEPDRDTSTVLATGAAVGLGVAMVGGLLAIAGPRRPHRASPAPGTPTEPATESDLEPAAETTAAVPAGAPSGAPVATSRVVAPRPVTFDCPPTGLCLPATP